jgi:drug/metabolite transporter (DMT)-like permease
MSAESPEARERIGRWRQSFRLWRWQRPFWAGLLTLLGGVPIIWIPYADPSLNQLSFRLATTTGSGSLIIGVLLFVLGLTLWFQPHSRVFAGVAAILLALVSLVVSNLGGLFVGFLLAMVGGAMGVSWAQDKERPAVPAGPAGAPAGPEPADAPEETGLAILDQAPTGADNGQSGGAR